MIGATSYLLLTWLLTCPLGSLQEDAEPVGGSRSSITSGLNSSHDFEYVGMKHNVINNIRGADYPDWLYVHLDESGIRGFSIRLDARVLLTATGLDKKELKLYKVKDMPDFFDPKNTRPYSLSWVQIPHETLTDLSPRYQMFLERFVPLGDHTSGWSPDNTLKLNDNFNRPAEETCWLHSYRKIANNLVTLSATRVGVDCRNAFFGEDPSTCQVSASVSLRNETVEFCPSDNGAPVFCGAGYLTLVLNMAEVSQCQGSAVGSRVHHLRSMKSKLASTNIFSSTIFSGKPELWTASGPSQCPPAS